jgi:hypothetical protein
MDSVGVGVLVCVLLYEIHNFRQYYDKEPFIQSYMNRSES